MDLTWKYEHADIDWKVLSDLYKIAPLGHKPPEELQKTFGNSLYQCFVFRGSQLVGAGRVLADGVDCAYLCDVAVHPDLQGTGIGKKIILALTDLAQGHKKIILYANPGTESFYQKLGFKRMLTAMARFENEDHALNVGLVSDT